MIARVPFDEGSLTGTLTPDITWPDGDWRNSYFTPENLAATLPRVERAQEDVPAGMTMPELALRHILAASGRHDRHSGHAEAGHVAQNLAASDARAAAPRRSWPS